jgi:hypothetical protein
MVLEKQQRTVQTQTIQRKQPLVSIITVNYNGLNMTTELLNSIRRLSYSQLEIFVVDNASKETPQYFLAEHYPEVHFIRSDENLGFAGGNNLAVREAKGDYLFFINNDAELTEACIERLVDLFQQKPMLGIVSPLICYDKESKERGRDFIQYAGMTTVSPLTARNRTLGERTDDIGQYDKPEPTAYPHGAAMMLSRQVLNEVGMMHDDFFLYYEELDWGERTRRAGFEIWLEPRAKVYHKESATVGKLSTLKTYYINRNRIYFMRRNFSTIRLLPFFLFLAFVTIPKNLLVFILRGQFDHAKAFLKAVFWNIKH